MLGKLDCIIYINIQSLGYYEVHSSGKWYLLEGGIRNLKNGHVSLCLHIASGTLLPKATYTIFEPETK